MTDECEVHNVHHPSVAVVHDMLLFPADLQMQVYGEVKDTRSVKICGTGKDSVNLCVNYMLGLGPEPQGKVGRSTFDLAQKGVTLFENAQRAKQRGD